MGDGALVEFASAVDAVECAVAMQKGVAERETAVPEDRRIAFRIGINIGDIIIEEGDIWATGSTSRRGSRARQAGRNLRRPQRVCQVKAKLGLAFEPMGEQRVKNIAEPVTVYRVGLGPGGVVRDAGRALDAAPLAGSRRVAGPLLALG